METLRSEVVKHMLEAADAKQASPLFNLPQHWDAFNDWCQDSPEATRVISRASDSIETFCLDQDEQLYCIAMSIETLQQVTKSLIEVYEDNALEKMFA